MYAIRSYYVFNPDQFPEIPERKDAADDEFLFHQGPTKGLGKIRFHDYNVAYNSISLPNIEIFKEQIEVLKELLVKATPTEEQAKDIDFLLNVGELFTLVAYGQLIIEKAAMEKVEDALLDRIFDFMVRDFSKYALQLYNKTSSTQAQMALCMKMIRKPAANPEGFEKIWSEIHALDGAYEMNP